MSQINEQAQDKKDQHSHPKLNDLGRARGGIGGRGGREPVIKPKNFTGTLKRIWLYVGKERKLLMIVFLCIAVESVLALFVPYLVGVSIDTMSIFNGKVNMAMLEQIVLILIAVYIGNGVLTCFQGWVMAGVTQQVVAHLRGNLFEKLQKLPIAFFDSHPHGEVMSRLSNDVDNVSGTIAQSTIHLMSGLIAIIGSLVMMIILSPSLTLVSVMIVPMVILLARVITKKTSDLFKEQQVQLGKLNAHAEETISGMLVVKAFNHEEKVVAEFNAVNSALYEVGLKAQIWSGFLMPLMNVINNIGFAFIAIVGGILAIKNLITIGVIASFVSYSRQFARPLNEMANIYNLLQSGVAGAERVFEVLDEQEEPADLPGAIRLENSKGHVVFENVGFSYRSDVPILKNISFDSIGGSSTALVGSTGAGKTTIVNLMARFYDVTDGR
ncbi:MAG: ABC transporter ATP-binding protein, partial [Sporomusaceae bacterium]|nr:ABC transporter ATP-binding protein [Sporomusaceae bacterium]